MLEQQQAQLVAGIRELYRRLRTSEGWPGAWLEESKGVNNSAVITDNANKTTHPLTHDILDRLDLLHVRSGEGGSPVYGNGSSTFLQQQFAGFDENCARLQQRLIREGASMVERRRGSQPQQKKQRHVQDNGDGQRRRKRLRTDLSHLDAYTDNDRETGIDNNKHRQDEEGEEEEEEEEDGNEVEDEPALVDAETITSRSTSASASPEVLTIKSLSQEKHQAGQAQQPQLLKFSNPFSENSLSPTPSPIPTLQLTRSSSGGVNSGMSNEKSVGFNYQRHQPLPFPNQFQTFSNVTASPINEENNLAATLAIKPHSPFRTGLNAAEAIRTSYCTSSIVTEAKSPLPSSEQHCEINGSKSIDTSADSLHPNTSSAAATIRHSTNTVPTTTTANQLATGERDIGSNTYQGSSSALQSVLSPTTSLSTAQPSPLTPLTPPISILRANSVDMTRAGSKNTNDLSVTPVSVPITGAAMTLTPSLIADLDNVDWQADGQHGLDGFNGFNNISNLDGMGGLNGVNGLTALGNSGVAGDTEMDFNRFIWA